MPAIFAITLPFFALVLCGWLAARQGVLPAAAIPGLNAFVLFFALPCMLFRFGTSMPAGQLVDAALVIVYLASALLMVLFTVALTWSRGPTGPGGVDLRNAAFGALVAAFPNTGFMGVPLLVALMGASAAGPAITTVLVDLIVTSTLCIVLAEAQRGSADDDAFDDDDRRETTGAVLWRSLRGALMNPLPWSIGLGAAAASIDLSLPGPIAQIVKMLGDAATPVALFTIGAVLWRAGQHAHTRTPVGRYLPVALIKLFLHPALVLSTGLVAKAAGLEVSAHGLTVLVLMAALPSASNVSLLAERYQADNGRVARIIMASTVLSFGSFSLLATLLVRPA
jgi:malonate transporter and related proteins